MTWYYSRGSSRWADVGAGGTIGSQSMLGWNSSGTESRPSPASHTNPRPSTPYALALVLILLPLPLLSCRSAGQSFSQGAFEELKALVTSETDAARKMLEDGWKLREADLQRKIEEGKATPLEVALWVFLGGLGAGGTKTVLERLMIGRRANPPPTPIP